MNKKIVFQLLILVLLFASCRHDTISPVTMETTPPVPNYANTSQWHIVDRQAPVDVFYIVSTEIGDYKLDGFDCHFAHTYLDSLRQPLLGEMVGVDSLLSGSLNFFSPFYRQCSLQSFASDSLVDARSPLAMSDIMDAFNYYLRHLSGGRPFILAGFSQGGMAVVEILKHLSPEAQKRVVAAYVIGWKVTEEDLRAAPYLRPAQDSSDLGVVICYNTVRDDSCAILLLSDGNRMAINPVNWRTDCTPATFTTSLVPDKLTVALDTTSLLLHLNGYSRTDYILSLFGREGNYHTLEIPLYQESLRRNMALRAERYIEQHKTR